MNTIFTPIAMPKIMIIDDNVDILESLKDVIEMENTNFIVKTSPQVEEAKVLAKDFLPDIALIDIKIDQDNGLDLVPILKSINPSIICIVMTAFRDTEYAVEAIKKGADDYLFKPLNTPSLISVLNRNIDNQKLLQEKHDAEQRFHAIFKHAQQLLFVVDPEGNTLDANNSAMNLSDKCINCIINKKFWELPWWGEDAANQECIKYHFEKALNGDFVEFEIFTTNCNAQKIYYEISIKPIINIHGEVAMVIPEARNITKDKENQKQIETLAFYDELTGLPNRRMFMMNFEQNLASSTRHNIQSALLFLDLDHFKNINDSLGHSAGDSLLQQVAERLVLSIRTEDVVARLGGDEFVVLLPLLSASTEEATHHAQVVAEKIRKQICKSFVLSGNEYVISSSIGIVLFPKMGRTLEDLIKYADTAMYQAKASGRNQASLYQEEMHNQANQRLHMENEIHQALKLNQFEVYYHPQYDTSAHVIGVEALIRWSHPTLGMISPNDFIPIAEDTGLIVPISKWILSHVCQQLQHEVLLAPTVSVNISPRHFRQHNFVDDITKVLDQTGFDPNRLKLEITENVVISDIQDTIQKINQLRQLGIKFSMDDFGTGYSSLSYLTQLPINQLKIDRSFISRMIEEPSQAVIVDTIIAMARSLGLEIIAEGVETETQLHLLMSKGCNGFQGFFYTQPLPFDQYRSLIQQTMVPEKIRNL